MMNISLKKSFLLAFVLITCYGTHIAQASDGLSDFGKRNVDALYGGYVFVNKSTCLKDITEAPENDPLAVLVVKCAGCTYKWVTSASGPDECTPKK